MPFYLGGAKVMCRLGHESNFLVRGARTPHCGGAHNAPLTPHLRIPALMGKA